MIVRYLVTIEAKTEKQAKAVFEELMTCAETIDQFLRFDFDMTSHFLGSERSVKETT